MLSCYANLWNTELVGDNRKSQSPAMLVCYVVLICRAALWNDELYGDCQPLLIL